MRKHNGMHKVYAGHHFMKGFMGTDALTVTKPDGTEEKKPLPTGALVAGVGLAAAVSGATSGVSAILLKYKFSDGFKIGALSTVLVMGASYLLQQGKK